MPISSYTRRKQTTKSDPVHAVEELVADMQACEGLHFVFATSPNDLNPLAALLKARCEGTVVGCTTPGNIGPRGFERTGAALLSLCGPQTRHWTWAISDLAHPSVQIAEIQKQIRQIFPALESEKAFGVLLSDAAYAEQERLSWALNVALPGIQVIEASPQEATDDPTFILHDGVFHQGISTFTLVVTDLPFSVFSLQRHRATDTRLAVTRANPTERRVFEMNGIPAAEAYADALGVQVDELTPVFFAQNPLIIKGPNRNFVRAPIAVNPDGSLDFVCGMEVGTIVRMGQLKDEIKTLRRELDDLSIRLGGTQAVLALDCVFRRVEYDCHGLDAVSSEVINEGNMVGSSALEAPGDSSQRSHSVVGVAFGAGVGRRAA